MPGDKEKNEIGGGEQASTEEIAGQEPVDEGELEAAKAEDAEESAKKAETALGRFSDESADQTAKHQEAMAEGLQAENQRIRDRKDAEAVEYARDRLVSNGKSIDGLETPEDFKEAAWEMQKELDELEKEFNSIKPPGKELIDYFPPSEHEHSRLGALKDALKQIQGEKEGEEAKKQKEADERPWYKKIFGK